MNRWLIVWIRSVLVDIKNRNPEEVKLLSEAAFDFFASLVGDYNCVLPKECYLWCMVYLDKKYLMDYRFDFIHTTLPRIKKMKPHIKKIDPLMIHYTQKPWRTNVLYQQDFEEILHKSIFYKSVFKKKAPKDIYLNQSFVSKNYPLTRGCEK